MKNLNYPTWESGIPQLLPETNPYNESAEYDSFSFWYKTHNSPPIIRQGTHNTISEWYLRDAWSYMEILHFLRDMGYFINVNVLVSGQYIGSLFQFTEDSYKIHYELGYIKYGDYYEALDEAILFTLNLIKQNEQRD